VDAMDRVRIVVAFRAYAPVHLGDSSASSDPRCPGASGG